MRRPLSNKERFEIFRRDGFTCQYCGATPPRVELRVDHIDPVANGGKCEEGNLITACHTCNSGKAARSILPADMLDETTMCSNCDEDSPNDVYYYFGMVCLVKDGYEKLRVLCSGCLLLQVLADANMNGYAHARSEYHLGEQKDALV